MPRPRVGTIQDAPLSEILAPNSGSYELANGGVILCAKSSWNLTGKAPAGSTNPHTSLFQRLLNIANSRDGYGFNENGGIAAASNPPGIPGNVIFLPSNILGAAVGELGFNNALA
jgi:hypothetical protein